MNKRIIPLPGKVLIRMLPPETMERGLHLPDIAADHANSPEDAYRRKPAEKGIVIAMGTWPRSKSGFSIMPPFGVGATVLINRHHGTKFNRDLGENYRIVKNDEVLAVLDSA